MKIRLGIVVCVFCCFGWIVLLTAQAGAQAQQDKIPGPWADARVGDRIQAKGLFEDVFEDLEVDIESTVIAADEQTVTVKLVRSAKGKKPKEFTKKLQRYMSKAEYEKEMAQFGEKKGSRKFTLDGKEIDAEEYMRKETDPKDRENYMITTTVISKAVPSWVLRVWRKLYIKGQPKRDKLLLDVKHFIRKGA